MIGKSLGEFSQNRYVLSIVEPVSEHGRRQPWEVEVYERLDTCGCAHPIEEVQHVRLVDSFSLYDTGKSRNLSLDEIMKRLPEVIRAKS